MKNSLTGRGVLLLIGIAVSLGGCVSQGSGHDREFLSENLDASQALLTFDVAFALAPDYKPSQSQFHADDRITYSGFPHIEVPYFQKGLDVDMGLTGLPYMLPIPYPVPKVDTGRSEYKVFGQRLDEQHYRFVVPSKSMWNSGHTFALLFQRRERRETITFRFNTQTSCASSLKVITPDYGYPLSVSAKFKNEVGCLTVCDGRPGYPGDCAFQPQPTSGG
ncbi:hypothetical protein HKK52_11815 [Pseudomonas sp. ADAK2]|uniref:hypothetical protein n=1 Tax=unclassified Pseudomonas TaxID=196821 RepID=UPI001462B447|nr:MULTISPECIES: hypothetical protein [unclassified Pseudomonas]QJI41573.1 hypothetical protein HKK53_11815 [Pseudomonas sp. ADAK7]QJI47877.1 hypothetical protein HKK52_11815 [Pseudomonas sp. ADAK2]